MAPGRMECEAIQAHQFHSSSSVSAFVIPGDTAELPVIRELFTVPRRSDLAGAVVGTITGADIVKRTVSSASSPKLSSESSSSESSECDSAGTLLVLVLGAALVDAPANSNESLREALEENGDGDEDEDEGEVRLFAGLGCDALRSAVDRGVGAMRADTRLCCMSERSSVARF